MNETSGDASLDSTSNVSSVAPMFVDPEILVNYVRRIFINVLEEEDSVSSSAALLTTLLDEVKLINKFVCDPQVKSIFVQKISNKDEDEDRADEYSISSEVYFTSIRAAGVILTKRGNYIEADKSFGSQVRTVVMNDGLPYETLHGFFKSYLLRETETGHSSESTSDKLAPSVEKELAEIQPGLLHLQQHIDIPEILLKIHPLIRQTVSFCAEENRRPRVADFGDKVDDSSVLNALQRGVNRWVKEIQKVTKLDRVILLAESVFFQGYQKESYGLDPALSSQAIVVEIDALTTRPWALCPLRHGKRFHATVSFDIDIGLLQAIATVNDYCPLMKDFPIHELLAATDLKKVRFAVQGVFVHLMKIRNTKYPIQRALRLVEAISRDLSTQLLKVLGTRRLMNLPYEEFERVMNSCFDIFNTWDEEFEKLQDLLRDIMKKKRDEMKIIWRVNPAHKKLDMRMEKVREFRRQHEQLRSVIERVLRLRPDQQTMLDGDAGEEVSNAYILVEEVEVLEMSKEGAAAWEAAVRRYNERVDTVEAKVRASLREQLGTAKSANEMFRIFARFKALFVRPQIRGAIREYQTRLIQRVQDDIEVLQEKFKTPYSLSKSYRMSQLRDIPPVSGSIIWAKQIDCKRATYLRRVEAVLGSGWEENHVDGQRLKGDGKSFRLKLNTLPIFEDWVAKVQQKDATVSGRIFDIEQDRVRGPTGKQNLKLKVNFLPEIITLSKEVRHLKDLGFRVPLAIMNKAHQANQMYPFAISLMESVRSYERSWEKIEDKANLILLVTGVRQEVQALIAEGMGLDWESYKLYSYVKKLSAAVFQFEKKVEEVLRNAS